MAYGLVACLTTKPGQRDKVVALLTSTAQDFQAIGCRHYNVGAACADEVTIWVSEVWNLRDTTTTRPG